MCVHARTLAYTFEHMYCERKERTYTCRLGKIASYQFSLTWLLSEPEVWTFWNVPVEKPRFIMQSVRLQPQDSEKGFWAWGRVTINLVKSTDESLSYSYNQRHFRLFFPQRNSCFLWHVLKFYFKNSQHLKAECCMLPRPSLTMCFRFSQLYPCF